MKLQRVSASSKYRGRRVIKASRSPQDLIDAFEARIAELEVGSCNDVTSSSDVTASDVVFITDSDKDIWYDDAEGLFGGDGMVSLADLKVYWNSAKDGDPSLAYYDDFQSWLRDTVNNGYLSLIDSEAYELVGASDIFDEVTEGQLNSREPIGMREIVSSEDEMF